MVCDTRSNTHFVNRNHNVINPIRDWLVTVKFRGIFVVSVTCKNLTKENMENTIPDNNNKNSNYSNNYKKDYKLLTPKTDDTY